MTLQEKVKYLEHYTDKTYNAVLILAMLLLATIGVGAKLYFTTQHQIKVIRDYDKSQQVLIEELYGENGG